MTYATSSDMTAQFGSREVVALTDRDDDGVIDAAVMASALAQASAEIDTYLVGRYTLPLANTFPMLTIYCCDIARYRLSGSDVAEVETTRNRYKDAIRFLESVRDGKTRLGADTGGAAATEQARIAVVGSDRVFDSGSLADFTG